MSGRDRLEPALRATLVRAASGPEPEPSLAEVIRRAGRRRAHRRLEAVGAGLLTVVALASTLALAAEQDSHSPTSVAARGEAQAHTVKRPVIGLPGCRPTWAREGTEGGVVFGRVATVEKSVQVLVDPNRPPPDGPLVIIERVREQATAAAGDGKTGGALSANATVGGLDATISPVTPEGQVGADFELADGTLGVLTLRRLTLTQVRQVLDALDPRSHPNAGFDLVAPVPAGMQLFDVTPPQAVVHTARSDCVGSDGSVLFVFAVSGARVARYAALSGVPADAIGRDVGDSTVAVHGVPGGEWAAALDAVTEASPEDWRRLLDAEP